MLTLAFFDRDACEVAQDLLGKVIRHKNQDSWLSARIIETEAYYLHDKASHASLGLTEKRKALFMPSGTIYMYYARGGDSLNVSCQGEGNAVLIKSGVPHIDKKSPAQTLTIMQRNNPMVFSGSARPSHKLCKGQTLLCKALGLKVKKWDQKNFHPEQFYIEDIGYFPTTIIQTRRLGIPLGRDEHLFYRFIDQQEVKNCTSNPLAKRNFLIERDFYLLAK